MINSFRKSLSSNGGCLSNFDVVRMCNLTRATVSLQVAWLPEGLRGRRRYHHLLSAVASDTKRSRLGTTTAYENAPPSLSTIRRNQVKGKHCWPQQLKQYDEWKPSNLIRTKTKGIHMSTYEQNAGGNSRVSS